MTQSMVKKKSITGRAYKYIDAIGEAINQNLKDEIKRWDDSVVSWFWLMEGPTVFQYSKLE